MSVSRRTFPFIFSSRRQTNFSLFWLRKGGTVFNFLQEIEGISFPESVKRVADLEHLSVDFDWSEPREVADTPETNKDGVCYNCIVKPQNLPSYFSEY